MNLQSFEKKYKPEWDKFILKSRNGLFMHLRDFMDYHSSRFDDASLIFRKKNKIIAVLPAHRKTKIFYSHLGLTFGGLIIGNDTKFDDINEVFSLMVRYLKDENYQSLYYKKIPHIFSRKSSDEDLHSLYMLGAKLIRRDLSACISFRGEFNVTKNRMQTIRKANAAGIVVKNMNLQKEFYDILIDTLKRHGSKPTHSFDELKLLADRFPSNITLKAACRQGNIVAGALLFCFDNVVHTQYLAASPEGKEVYALDAIIYETIKSSHRAYDYLSFGASSTDNGHEVNRGLMFYKESFGAKAIVLDHYQLKI